MRTTVILPDELYRQVKQRARADDRTVTSFLEEALRRELARRDEAPATKYEVVPFHGEGGTLPGVDLDNHAALLDIMEEGLPLEKRR